MAVLTRIFVASLTFLSVLSVDAKRSHFSPVERHIKRATTDRCAYVIKDLVSPMNAGLGTSIPSIFGTYAGCLCVSNAQNMVNTYLPLSLGASMVGSPAAITWLTNYINSYSGTQTCVYPTGASPSCSSSSVCGFTCTGGLTKVGSSCQCVAPNIMCNGKCTNQACPTGGLSRRENNVLMRTSVCPAGTEKCGVLRRSSSLLGYECLITQSDLESCGGCVTPWAGEKAGGQDCTAIPGTANVQCTLGKCHIGSCREGWNMSSDGQSCEQIV